jgi:branched-chain amino acid transport system ATP-binding protein
LANSITVANVDAGYGSVRVLHDVSMRVDDGETVVLLGSNGNGKSTLIKCITGIVTPSGGHIALESDGSTTELVGMTPEAIVDLGVALVPEGRRLFPALSVEENLMLGAFRPAARARIADNLDFVYGVFPVLRERRRQQASSMSGGEQQMVALGRALMSAPTFLLVDEPSVGLAPILVSRVIANIKELKEQKGLTVLMAEQNFNQAIKIADRAYVMVHGRIEFEGDTAQLQDNPMIKRYYLGA